MVATLLSFGMQVDKILIDNLSKNTYDNAYFTKLFCLNYSVNSLKVITSKFHARRAKMIFEKVFGRDYSINFITVIQHEKSIQSLREKFLILTLPFIFLLPAGNHMKIKEITDNLTRIFHKPIYGICKLIKLL